ncbi:hypothetical protein E2986_10684 [Frieseomelitta varia]|uniref:N-acetylneuraminate lyase n=1 Tax=Frieseomelitta varia TaxID=561572 RepID=A0A833RD51_9HYME|nr:hypothetical protein E2986_10684 [Frieseomelitta varia]
MFNEITRTLNLSVIPQYANHLANKKVNGVLVNGTSGEGPSMSTSERKLVAEAWANAVRTTKQHLMIQVGGASLPDVLELAKHAESIKADSILCLPELYFKPSTSEQLKDYLRLVSSAAPNTPLLYYHIPMFTNVNGKPIINNCDDPDSIPGDHTFQLMDAACAIGMNSFIITSLSMFPELTVETFTAGNAGNLLKARETQQRLTNVLTSIGKYGTFIETMKAAMSLLTNINPGPPRVPQQPLSAETVASMAKDLQNLGYSFLPNLKGVWMAAPSIDKERNNMQQGQRYQRHMAHATTIPEFIN